MCGKLKFIKSKGCVKKEELLIYELQINKMNAFRNHFSFTWSCITGRVEIFTNGKIMFNETSDGK